MDSDIASSDDALKASWRELGCAKGQGLITSRICHYGHCVPPPQRIQTMAKPDNNSSVARIGCAGWSIPAAHKADFGDAETALQRYATVLNAVEINSTFYRAHRPDTFIKWAQTVPDHFRFSVKLPRAITQFARLCNSEPLLDEFADQIIGLGDKLGVLLVQLPPSLILDDQTAGIFFRAMRQRWPHASIACEPRHASWNTQAAHALYREYRVMGVAADPPRWPGNDSPTGPEPGYWRLHGSPRIYYSAYSDAYLAMLAKTLSTHEAPWVIFDNTASGSATANALKLAQMLQGDLQL